MSDRERDDIDLATAAEQSSEVDEAQEGNSLLEDELSVESAEEAALHLDGENVEVVESDLDEELDARGDAVDAEADAVVEDALDIDSLDEAEAAVAATDDASEVFAEEAAAEVDPNEPQFDEDGNEIEADPYEAFRLELKGAPGRWYVIHSYAGFEKRVKQNIENRKISMTMEDSLFQIEVPMEDVVEIKNGQRKLVNRVRIPGYVLVRMDLNEDSWSVVRHTPGVTG
ncbi:MAG: transcription termination/antitermination protein NusG, partial [Microbacteriaceae bacterium]|nr:transcription termination/antitermination protein NusG [Microbacteriaceae bacterium]